MNTPDLGYRMGTGARAGAVYDEGLRSHMLRVYNYMGIGLVVTGLVAMVVASTPALYVPIFSSPLKWVVMLAPLAFVLLFSFKMQTMSAASAQAMFWAFCAIWACRWPLVFLVFTGTSIARTFFIAATMFGATSLYGYTTRRDLTQFSSFMIMGLIGVVIASIVNIFLGSTALQFAISVIGIAVFIGLTAWDTQKIKEQYAENFDAESRQKLAVFGAFSLYLNFINIFQLLLNFTGERDNGQGQGEHIIYAAWRRRDPPAFVHQPSHLESPRAFASLPTEPASNTARTCGTGQPDASWRRHLGCSSRAGRRTGLAAGCARI